MIGDVVDHVKMVVEIITLVVLILTLVYIIFYWKETQRMKEEMVKQNKISAQAQVISNIPVIDIYFEKDTESEETWNTFIENKGNGTAISVFIHRQINELKSRQQRAIAGGNQIELKPYTKKYKFLEPGAKKAIFREYGKSLDYMEFTVACRDIFGKFREYKFEGSRMEPLNVVAYPFFEDLSDTADDNNKGDSNQKQ